MISRMFCPLCAATVPLQQPDCPSCGCGLAEYAAVWYFPDQLFNEGVVALHRERYDEAVARFAHVCRLRPDDDGARRGWAYACSRLGRHEQAVGILLDIADVATRPEADEQYGLTMAALEAQLAPSPVLGPDAPTPGPQEPLHRSTPRTAKRRSKCRRKRHR